MPGSDWKQVLKHISYQLGNGKEDMGKGVTENKAERTMGALAPEVRWCTVIQKSEGFVHGWKAETDCGQPCEQAV